MNKLQLFNNEEFGPIRMIEIDGKPYAVGVDVAKALEYANPSKAVIDHCRGISKLGIPHMQTNQHGYVGEVTQETNVIPRGDIYRLIVKAADQSRSSKIREKAERFEKWIFDEIVPAVVATGYYTRPKSALEMMELQFQAIKEVDSKVELLGHDYQQFKRDMPILGIEESKITTAVKKKGVACLGGKDSNAYQDKSLRSKVYCDIYSQIKRQFGVTSYKAVKRSQCDQVIRVVDEYMLPLILDIAVSECNAQTKFVG